MFTSQNLELQNHGLGSTKILNLLYLYVLEYTPLLLCSRCLSLSAKERRAIAFLLRRCAMHKVAVMGK